MVFYNGFKITKSVLISGQFKRKYSSLNALSWKPNIRNTSHSWLDSTIEPAAGCDMYCHNHDNLRILRAHYNSNQPALDLSDYQRSWFYEDAVKENFRDDAFKLRKNQSQ